MLKILVCISVVLAIVFAEEIEHLSHEHLHEHHNEHHHNTHPQYTFEYGVNDPHTHDVKKQWETRDGDKVQGSYSLKEADGTVRIVDYHANDETGFKAVVRREGHSVHPTLHHHVHPKLTVHEEVSLHPSAVSHQQVIINSEVHHEAPVHHKTSVHHEVPIHQQHHDEVSLHSSAISHQQVSINTKAHHETPVHHHEKTVHHTPAVTVHEEVVHHETVLPKLAIREEIAPITKIHEEIAPVAKFHKEVTAFEPRVVLREEIGSGLHESAHSIKHHKELEHHHGIAEVHEGLVAGTV